MSVSGLDGRWLRINDAYCRMPGYERTELLGASFRGVTHPNLKIDMQFVQDLLSDEEDRRVVQAIVRVARQFKIETIAEGVEDRATLDELRRIGVDFAQGYVIGRPAPLPQGWKSPRNRRQGDTHATRA
jgi:predicted signal transduction protein with EAL and GGDEF domain